MGEGHEDICPREYSVKIYLLCEPTRATDGGWGDTSTNTSSAPSAAFWFPWPSGADVSSGFSFFFSFFFLFFFILFVMGCMSRNGMQWRQNGERGLVWYRACV